MYVEVLVNGRRGNVMIDTGATHNLISQGEARRLGLKPIQEGGSMKAVNSAAKPVHGVARNIPTKLGDWSGNLDFTVATMDDFKLALGMDFLRASKAVPMPHLGSVLVAGQQPCLLKTCKMRKGSKGPLLSAMQLKKGLKRNEPTFLATLSVKEDEAPQEIPATLDKLLTEFEDLLPKDLPKKDRRWEWSEKQQKAFQKLKDSVVKELVLALPNPNKPFEVETDASDFALGGVLLQDGHPIAFESRKSRQRSTSSAETCGSRTLVSLVIFCYGLCKHRTSKHGSELQIPPPVELAGADSSSVSLSEAKSKMLATTNNNESALSVAGPRPMEWSTVPYNAPQAPGPNGRQRTSSLESPIMLLTGHQSAVYTMKFNRKEQSLHQGHKNAVLDLHWTTDGTQLVSASPDKTVRAWDAETGKQIKKMAEHSSFGAIQTFPDKYQITAVCFSDASDKIYTGGIDNDVKVWDVRKNEVTLTLQGHQDMITGMSLSADGSYLLTNGMDCKLCIWDMRPYAPQNRCVKVLEGHQHNFEKNLLKCAWSPDGSKVTAGNADRMVYIWDTTTRRILYKLPGHTGSVNESVFHPREPIVGSCSSDKQIYLGEL
uniref:Reverse transcriptase/retrotransposon-derived protein RNase H-like domain-containing protein n=1 Tax=Chenopodium quinoa TaxID=63459 RepID=A0A803LYG3_CHEQI